MPTNAPDVIDASPTKTFFVEMLIKDIPLEQAILDLVDNSVDGAKRALRNEPKPFKDKWVEVEFNKNRFRIIDNCGGFDREIAREYAFKFGRKEGQHHLKNAIGQFGVGMKRALFKFGHHFQVMSATTDDVWGIDVPVPDWEQDPSWTFPWAAPVPPTEVSKEQPGTEIIVDKLRPGASARFSSKIFENEIVRLLKSKHRRFIQEGLSVKVNGTHVVASSIELLVHDALNPALKTFSVDDPDEEPVSVKLIAGVGRSSPKEAGWYVICNGRVVLEADTRPVTGWGHFDEDADAVLMPRFHNQFARFRGIALFESADSGRVPWNTTKTDVDQDSRVWRDTFDEMIELMRPVLTFLNDLDADVDEYGKDKSPLLAIISKANSVAMENVSRKGAFLAPDRQKLAPLRPIQWIRYSKDLDDVDFLKDQLSVSSPSAVGSTTFDLILRRFRKQ